MRKRWRLSSLLLILLVASTAVAAQGSILERLKAEYRKIHSVKGDFIQETTLGVRKKTVYQGKVFIVPGKSRWDYEAPNPQLVITQGDRFLLYDPINKEAVKGTLDKEAIVTRGPFFSLVDQIQKYYNVTETREGKTPVLILIPKEKGTPIQKVTVYLNPQTLLIERIETLDSLGNLNTVTFKNIKTNVPIDPAIFQVKLPPDVKVSHP